MRFPSQLNITRLNPAVPDGRPRTYVAAPDKVQPDGEGNIHINLSNVDFVWLLVLAPGGGDGSALFGMNPILVDGNTTLTVEGSPPPGEYDCVVYVPAQNGLPDDLADANSPPKIII